MIRDLAKIRRIHAKSTGCKQCDPLLVHLRNDHLHRFTEAALIAPASQKQDIDLFFGKLLAEGNAAMLLERITDDPRDVCGIPGL